MTKIIIVSNVDYNDECFKLTNKYPNLFNVIQGGKTRIQSVNNANNICL